GAGCCCTAATHLSVSDHEVSLLNQGNAFWQLYVTGVQNCTAFQLGQVDFDTLRQIARQARDFDFSHRVGDDGRRQLHSRRNVCVQELEGHLGGDALVLGHTLEVNVQNLLLVGVPLNSTQQNRANGLAVDDQVQNGGMVLFLADCVVGFVVIQLDVQRLYIAAVNDGGNTACAAQAAARTRTLIAARSGVEFHGMLQVRKVGSMPLVVCGRNRMQQATATSRLLR